MLRKFLTRSFGLNLLLTLLRVPLSLTQDTNEATLSSIYQVNQQNCGSYSSTLRQSSCHNLLNPKEVELISNGQDAQEGMFPSYVQLDIKIGLFMNSMCGGVIISKQHILTAAHCVATAGIRRIEAHNSIRGMDDFQSSKYEVERVCSSRKYSHNIFETNFDVAILKLAQPVRDARPACLPQNEISFHEPAWAVGLGLSSKNSRPNILQRLNVKRVQCSYMDSHMSHICFKASHVQGTVCQGDSGGPIYTISNGKQTVVGLTSYGRVAECERRDHTAVFSNVHELRKEIENLYLECQ